MKYFRVITSGGHMGTHNDRELIFYFKAPSIIDAMRRAQSMPGVKHNRIPPSVSEISYDEYLQHKNHNAYEKYKKH